jgi:hypothetical protein
MNNWGVISEAKGHYSQAPAPKKKPTAKWCDMSLTIYTSKKCKQNTAEKNGDSDVEDDFADEPDANKGDEQSDSEESEEKDDADVVTGWNGFHQVHR